MESIFPGLWHGRTSVFQTLDQSRHLLIDSESSIDSDVDPDTGRLTTWELTNAIGGSSIVQMHWDAGLVVGDPSVPVDPIDEVIVPVDPPAPVDPIDEVIVPVEPSPPENPVDEVIGPVEPFVPSDRDDKFSGGMGKDIIRGRKGNDSLAGNAGKDKLIGGKGDDILDGGKGKDTLLGNAGKDTLIGGDGTDKVVGGSGADIFVLEIGKGFDKIRDFGKGNDKFGLAGDLQFSDLEFTQLGSKTLISVDGDYLARVRKTSLDDLTSEVFTRQFDTIG